MNIEYIISNIMILLTVCIIPFALKSKNRTFSFAAILLPLIANVALYIYFDKQASFGYLALVGATSLLLIRKKGKKSDDLKGNPAHENNNSAAYKENPATYKENPSAEKENSAAE